MFIYKEDFNKFAEALVETVNYVKTDLMPDFDFDAFNHTDDQEQYEQNKAEQSKNESVAAIAEPVETIAVAAAPAEDNSSDVEAWKI